MCTLCADFPPEYTEDPRIRQAQNYVLFILIEYIFSCEAPICEAHALSWSCIFTSL